MIKNTASRNIRPLHVNFWGVKRLLGCRGKHLFGQGAKRNMSSAVCALSMYSRLCMKMSSFLFVRACAVPRMLYLSCGIPFPV